MPEPDPGLTAFYSGFHGLSKAPGLFNPSASDMTKQIVFLLVPKITFNNCYNNVHAVAVYPGVFLEGTTSDSRQTQKECADDCYLIGSDIFVLHELSSVIQ
ncbi:hypothetical protein PoB_005783400 [Plakobranchus ocellatus]|uniref:Uncharacterized protein n=1 Tax=Plakobranchus ocellatus TaxID=259542 RepID=A0AAV4CJK7_9GAST|nr:hypothetical protein PoB_005783400 [Plakobranchus ocellatus]